MVFTKNQCNLEDAKCTKYDVKKNAKKIRKHAAFIL